MGSFNVVIDPHAARDLKKLRRSNPPLTPHLIKAVDSLSINPYQGKPLKGDKKG